MLLTPFPLHWSEVTASSLQRVRLADGNEELFSVLGEPCPIQPRCVIASGSIRVFVERDLLA